MPFQSEKQRRYLYAKKPAVAKKFAKDARSEYIAAKARKRKRK